MDVERDGCRRESEGIGGSVSDLLVRGSSVGALNGNACPNDQFVCCQRVLDIWRAAWLDMQVVNRDGSRAARAHSIERRIDRCECCGPTSRIGATTPR